MTRFDAVQARLGEALAANRPGSGVGHVLVVLPSFSVGESLLSHYADRIPSLEHRYLLVSLLVGRMESCEVVFVTCSRPDAEVLAYYASLLPSARPESGWARFRLLAVPDFSARPVAAKLLDRPDLVTQLKTSFAGRPAFIEPWNVTDAEVEVACRLGAPVNGTSPALRPLAFKSAGRRLFARAGVPRATGVEDVHTVDDVLDAIDSIRAQHPGLPAVVIKHDDSGAGDGNMVIDLATLPSPGRHAIATHLARLPQWYLDDLASGGGVVERLITGEVFASPSAQIDITPDGDVVVLATHEQVLGGDSGQVYMGCRFPADEAYAAVIARHALAIGRELARHGAIGRVGVDFAAARDAAGRWTIAALEINLRKGGTTHPYSTLRNIVPGHYDVDAGRWICEDGTTRSYIAHDNVIDAAWYKAPPAAIISAIGQAGLQFDHATGTGVVLYMLSGLAIDGRFGMIAIGRTPDDAQQLFGRALAAAATGTA